MKHQAIKRKLTEEEIEKRRQIFFKISLSMFLLSLFFVAFVLGNGFLYIKNVGYVNAFSGNDFQFHVINVGQGDCFLIKLPDEKVLLIDCGEQEQYPIVKGYLNEFLAREKLSQIDYLILTHQDSDHLGCASNIIQEFDVKFVYRPKVYSSYEFENGLVINDYYIFNTEIFNNFTISLYQKNIAFGFNEKGVMMYGENYTVEFLSPNEDKYSASNNYSAVIMLNVADKKILLTGDATEKIEKTLIEEFGDTLKSDVLKISHHGSATSSCQEFLDKVKPEFSLLSVGDNDSGLPSVDVLNRLYKSETTIFSTKKLGCFALSIENGQIVMQSQPLPDNQLPLLASITILLICFVWGVNFNVKPLRKDANMIV